MIRSLCLCSNKPVIFTPYIRYHNNDIFRHFEGIVIGKCTRCGLLKTLPPEKMKFDPKQSRGDMYESRRSFFSGLFAPIVDKIKKYKPSGSILDVGCASGLLLELLQKDGYEIVGVEPNTAAYGLARKKLGKNIFHGTLSAYVKTHRKKFDAVIYNHVLEHIEDIGKELILVKNVLKTNGVCIFGLPNTDNSIFFLRGKYWEPLMPQEHIWHFSKKYFADLLRQNGYTVYDISFSDDNRIDYPWAKRIYFSALSFINRLMHTGEAILIVAKNSDGKN